MATHWYAWKPTVFDLPRATSRQVKRAQTLLHQTGAVPVGDYDSHVGALTLLRDHLHDVAEDPPEHKELMRRVRAACRRPGFRMTDPWIARHRAPKWEWIEPSTIARGRLGKPFTPTHHSVKGIAQMAAIILAEQGDTDGLVYLFGDPRSHVPCVVVDSVPGPFGPVRPITINGNHRTLALEALGAPIVMAEVRDYVGPFSIQYSEDDEWKVTFDFLRWLESHGAVRLSARPIIRENRWLRLRISDAPAPWLATSPEEALATLDAYEVFHNRKVDHIGALDTKVLRRQWKSAATVPVRQPITLTAVKVPARPHLARPVEETPPKRHGM
jgi:hypothetical protein